MTTRKKLMEEIEEISEPKFWQEHGGVIRQMKKKQLICLRESFLIERTKRALPKTTLLNTINSFLENLQNLTEVESGKVDKIERLHKSRMKTLKKFFDLSEKIDLKMDTLKEEIENGKEEKE